MSLLIKFPLFAPADTVGGSEGAEESVKNFLLSEDDDEAIDLKADEKLEETAETVVDDVTETADAEDTEETDEKVEETLEDEIEEELKEPDEDKLEASLDPPTRRQILAKYPNLFKDIPYLETAFYREQKFTEIYPSLNDARVASEKSQSLDNFSQALLEGDLEQVFAYALQEDKNSFHKLVDNMMVHLGKVDENAQLHVISNIGKHIVQQMHNAGKNSEDGILSAAAHVMYQFITGTKEWIPPSPLAKESKTDPEKEQFQRERQEFQNQRFTAVRDELVTTLDKRIEATLNKEIDPKGTMTEFTRNAAITEAKKQIQRAIKEDSRFQKLTQEAWRKAARSNYSEESKSSLKKYYTNKAQVLLPTIIKNVRAQALKGLSRKVDGTVKNEIREPQKRGPVAPGNSTPDKSRQQSAQKRPPAGMGVKEWLMSD